MLQQQTRTFSCADDCIQYQTGVVSAALSRYPVYDGKHKKRYIDSIVAFDIETSKIPYIEQNILYLWQLQIGTCPTIYGRDWPDLLMALAEMADAAHGCIVVVYVHNLSYEYQFFRSRIPIDEGSEMVIKARKVIRCTSHDGALEWRCSFALSRQGLGAWAAKLNVPHQKLDGGEFDYAAVRYPWTPLPAEKLEYGLNDVRAVVECVHTAMLEEGDNLYTIPMTATGYLRRDVNEALKNYRFYLKKLAPNYDLYTLLREAFRGGNTHANRYYAGVILHDVKCADRSSSYPDVMINRKFPATKFEHIGPCTPSRYKRLLQTRAVLARITLHDVRLRDKYDGCPYLTIDKSRKLANYAGDNGRVLSADYLETTVTDVDFAIICRQYTFSDCAALDVYAARYGELPQPLAALIVKLYNAKTELKGVKDAEPEYRRAKERINSAYGLTAQNPVKPKIIVQNGAYVIDTSRPEDEILDDYYLRGVMPYQWGVWVTAWARDALQQAIDEVGHSFVYCDTDSVYYIDDGTDHFAEFNRRCIDADTHTGMAATDPRGEWHYSGVYEAEETCEAFATLGAKKYAKIVNGQLKITMAGVDKRKGPAELQAAGGLAAFVAAAHPGARVVFADAGGTESIYYDRGYSDDHGPVEIDGHTIYISSNVVIEDSTYTLGVTAEYERLLDACGRLDYIAKNRGMRIDK